MKKVMVINGVWAALICAMLTFSVVLHHQPADAVDHSHFRIASSGN